MEEVGGPSRCHPGVWTMDRAAGVLRHFRQGNWRLCYPDVVTGIILHATTPDGLLVGRMAVRGDQAMFAPPIKATKSKAASHAAPARGRKAPRHMFLQPTLSAAEQMLMLTVQRISHNQVESTTEDKFDDYPTQEIGPASWPVRGLRQGYHGI
jgi:hypothetical protein